MKRRSTAKKIVATFHTTIINALKQKAESERAIANLLKAIEMGIFSPATKQRLDELEQQKEKMDCEMLVQSIFKASPIDEETVYNYFLSFKNLD